MLLVLAVSPIAGASTLTPLQKLRHRLQRELTQTTSEGSALVYDATTGQRLFAHDAHAGRIPASVEKLYTTSTALFDFGPNARLHTRIYGTGKLKPNGTWRGTLYLKGGGDPTFGGRYFNRTAYGAGANVQRLVRRLKQLGIKRVRGRIIADESYFDTLRGGPDTGYQANLETEGELSALSYDAGFTSLYEDKLQAQPALWAARALRKAMRSAGIRVTRSTTLSTGTTPGRARLVVEEASPRMHKLIELTNSPSDNFFAETLLKGLGAAFGTGGTTNDGAAVVRSVIAARLGLHPQLNDGSGLSRYDRTTVAQVVSLLRQMQGNHALYNSLSIAGVRGTLANAMLGTRAANNLRGKTGTLHDVANMVGYCTARNGDQLVFAFLMNGLTDPYWGHQVEDQMGVALADYNG